MLSRRCQPGKHNHGFSPISLETFRVGGKAESEEVCQGLALKASEQTSHPGVVIISCLSREKE